MKNEINFQDSLRSIYFKFFFLQIEYSDQRHEHNVIVEWGMRREENIWSFYLFILTFIYIVFN